MTNQRLASRERKRPEEAPRGSSSGRLRSRLAPAFLLAAAPSPSDDAVRKRLDDILSRPEFRPGGGQDPNAWLNPIARFFRWLGTLNDTAPVLFWLLLIVCVILLLLLFAHMGWTVRRVFFLHTRRTNLGEAEAQRLRRSLDYWQEGQRHATQRNFTEAIRCLFLSVVCRFDESGRVNFPVAVTNREYLALFHDRPRLQDSLKVFVDLLDDCWYGVRPAEAREYEACLALYDGLVSG